MSRETKKVKSQEEHEVFFRIIYQALSKLVEKNSKVPERHHHPPRHVVSTTPEGWPGCSCIRMGSRTQPEDDEVTTGEDRSSDSAPMKLSGGGLNSDDRSRVSLLESEPEDDAHLSDSSITLRHFLAVYDDDAVVAGNESGDSGGSKLALGTGGSSRWSHHGA